MGFCICFIGICDNNIGYACYDAEKSMDNVGKSVIVNGDTLEIVEWTQYGDLYVLSNGLIYHYEDRN